MFRSIDSRAAATLECWCQKLQRHTGITNYFLLQILAALFLVLITVFFVWKEARQVEVPALTNTFITLGALWSFCVSCIYCSKEESRSRERIDAGIGNPKRHDVVFINLRNSVLVSTISLAAFWAIGTLSFPLVMDNRPTMLTMLCATLTMFFVWVGLLLDACDPLT